MARNVKPGISFYRVDTGHIQNKKIRLLFNKYGAEGYYVWKCIIDYGYKEWGYYFDMNDAEGMEWFASEYCRVPLERIMPIIDNCILRGLFHAGIARDYNILTSEMMQDIFIHATQERRKKGSIFQMDQNWCCFPVFEDFPKNIKIFPGKNGVIPAIIPQIQDTIQDTTGENILGQGHENDGISDINPDDASLRDYTDLPETLPAEEPGSRKSARKKFVPPNFEQVKSYMMGTVGNPANGNGYWPEDIVHNEANKLMDHYIANGWKQGKGKAIVDWQATCRTWIRNYKEGTFSNSSNNVHRATYSQAPASPALHVQRPGLNKNQIELNYFFDRFREDPTAVTIISIDPLHYNTLKDAGLISFDESEVKEIKENAIDHLKTAGVENNDQNLLRFMKKVGVLHFFKQISREDRETIFRL